MAIRNQQLNQYESFVEGLDDTSIIGSKETEGTLSRAWNCNIVDDSLIIKRSGYSAVTASAVGGKTTAIIRAGTEYVATDGSSYNLVYAERNGQTSLYKVDPNGVSTTPTGANTFNSALFKPQFMQYRNLSFILSSDGNGLFDGTQLRQIGIDQPTTAPTQTNLPVTGGTTVALGVYVYAYTYYNTATGAESSPSPPSLSIVSTGAQGYKSVFVPDTSQATFPEALVIQGTQNPGTYQQVPDGDPVRDPTVILLNAANSAQADKIHVYRTTNGGSDYFLVAEIDGASTSYSDTSADGDLGDQMELDNTRPSTYGTASFGIIHENRIFAGGYKNNPCRTQYSKIGQNGPMPESFQVDDFVDCKLSNDDPLMGYGIAASLVLAIKKKSFGRFVGIQTNTGGFASGGSTKYLYQEISGSTTAVNPDTVISLEGKCIWLGTDDIYMSDGNSIQRIGGRIRKTIKSLNFSQAAKFSAIIKRDTQQVIFSVCGPGENECYTQIVGHYRSYPTIGFTLWKAGTNAVTHPGMPVASLFTLTTGGTVKYLFGSAASDGKVYQMDNSGSDNGNPIYFDVRMPWDIGTSQVSFKKFHSFYCFAASNGVSTGHTLTHTLETDGLEDAIVYTATTTLTSSGTNWAGANWAAFNWGSTRLFPQRFYPQKRAYFARYGFNNTYVNQPVVVKGVSRILQMSPIHR